MRAVRVVVHGDVQGVGFRYFTRSQAGRLGLMGWVLNRPEGTVEAWAEGSPEAVEHWLAALRRGPEGSWVRLVEQSEESPQLLRGFEVRWASP
ncbi:MAG: acylphosphatase [Candidatus Xenobia bacterium]